MQAVKKNLTARPCVFPPGFDLNAYQLFRGEPQRVLHDGDRLDLGSREIRVIHTPGHSPGHCCFYDPERKYLFTGDLIYQGCLDAFYPSTDLQLFYASVQKIRQYEIDAVFPGHHRLDIPVFLISEIENGFAQLSQKNLLKQGGGLFDFGDFQIRI